MHSLADYLKLFTEVEMEELFSGGKSSIDLLMAMLLSRMDRVFKWTDEALSIVI